MKMKNTKDTKITNDGALRLRDIIVGGRMKPSLKTKFKVKSDDKIGFISLECLECSEVFGVKASFAEKLGEVNFHYCCPYCHYEGPIIEK